MRSISIILSMAVGMLLFFSSCEIKSSKIPKVETLSAIVNNENDLFVTLSGRISGLEDITMGYQCGIEYSINESFSDDNTYRLKVSDSYFESEFTIDAVEIVPIQKYYYRAYCINKMEVYYGEVKDFTSGEWSGPREVDLGLTVKWATCNVGAYNIWSKGGYYAWGETEAKKDYSYSTYKWCRGSYNTLTKYNNISVCGEVDNELTLYPEDDVAQVKWGGNWRMPTLSEQDDLRNKCTWEWFDNGNSEFNGVAGYKVTSNVTGYTDRFIFLPAAEDIYDTDFYHVGWGLYWSSSVNWNNPYLAWVIYFNSSEVGANCLSGRGSGCSVRPVCP